MPGGSEGLETISGQPRSRCPVAVAFLRLSDRAFARRQTLVKAIGAAAGSSDVNDLCWPRLEEAARMGGIPAQSPLRQGFRNLQQEVQGAIKAETCHQ